MPNPMTDNPIKPEFIPTQASDVSEVSGGETYDYVKGTNGKPSTALVEELVASETGHVTQPTEDHTAEAPNNTAATKAPKKSGFTRTRKGTMAEGS